MSVHRGSFRAGGWWWYVGAVLLLSAVVNFAQATDGTGAGAVRFRTASAGSVPLGLGSLALGIVFLIAPVARWRQRVELFERGLVWRRLLGTISVARADVREVQLVEHRGRAGTYHEVRIARAPGRALSMVGLERAEQLANMLATSAGRPAPAVAVTFPSPPAR